MSEVLFYHLERQPLEQVLPALLEKTLGRGWRAVVEVGTPERLEFLDTHLWTYRPDSFLPHGTAKDGDPRRQPVFLTTSAENPNGATVRFLVDGAASTDFAAYERVVCIFDGGDDEAVQRARVAWRTAKAAGAAVTYWQQSEAGRWEKKA